MSDPSNPNGDWQQVPQNPAEPAGGGYPSPTNYPPEAGNYPPQTPNYPPPPQGQYPPPGYVPSAPGLSPTAAAAISYLTFIPAVVFLLMEPYKRTPFVRFHAIQSIALNVVAFAVGMVLNVMTVGMGVVGMWTVMALVHGLLNLLFFVAWLIAIIQASQGKWFKLPLIGDFALKQAQK